MHMNKGTGSKLSALICLMFYIHNIHMQCIVYVWNPMHAFTWCKWPFKSNLNVNAQLYALVIRVLLSSSIWLIVLSQRCPGSETWSSASAEITMIWCDIVVYVEFCSEALCAVLKVWSDVIVRETLVCVCVCVCVCVTHFWLSAFIY